MRKSVFFLIVIAFALVAFGVLMVYSATAPSSIQLHVSDPKKYSLFSSANSQLQFALIGIALCAVTAFIPMRFFRAAAPIILIAALVLQSLIFTSLGHTVAGNTNWISIAGRTLQPSEFLKLALIIFLARDLTKYKPGVDYKWEYLKWAGTGAVAAGALVLAGGDLGTTLIFILIVFGMFWLSGGPTRYLVLAGALGVLGLAVLVAYRSSRLTRFQQYFDTLFSLPDAESAPSQVDYALWAFGSGGLGGTGFGTSREKWPGNMSEAQTDFIFAVVGEEFGLAGTVLLMMAFMALGGILLYMAHIHPDRFARLLITGIALWLSGQALANMMVVTGLLPVFGVPLPFISLGGSSMLASLLAIGVVLSCAFDVEGVRQSFTVRRSARRAKAVMSGGSNE
ncbi:MAG: FtsW/RodA/SpoVE family cell cycle protein [Actinomycetaceae bacterium]|nr:FtsW/RodA/SpoVE family cell cycle protein [Actinomycetaceae bacterium]